MRVRTFSLLVLFIALPLLAGFLGTFATAGNVTGWFTTIAKPSWNPPNWLFAPVWTTLYVLMGIASFRVLRSAKQQGKGFTLTFYFLHLILNAFWSIAFFGMHDITLAFGVILALWASILFLAIRFWKYSRTAGILMLPYLAWVSFATCLNLAILLAN